MVSDMPIIRNNTIAPSLFELSASRIAHYLFPENFAQYKFILEANTDYTKRGVEVSAGYVFKESIKNTSCEDKLLEGIENVYATAFFLGLELDSHLCVNHASKNYLFIDDFSHAFHEVDVKHKTLIPEYRDHKILSPEDGTLFPTSLIDKDCGKWIGKECDTDKLKSAYARIQSIPLEEINNIIDLAIDVLQLIECQGSCEYITHYLYMNETKEILANNHGAIEL
jgi:hypothetical protein